MVKIIIIVSLLVDRYCLENNYIIFRVFRARLHGQLKELEYESRVMFRSDPKKIALACDYLFCISVRSTATWTNVSQIWALFE